MKLRLTPLLVIGTIVAVHALAQTYTIQNLGGPLPGTFEPQGVALNDLGQACGVCASNGYFATLFSDGQVIGLPATIPGDFTYAEDIDDSGVVVGFQYNSKAGSTRAVIWNKGTVQDITSLSLFPGGQEANAINKQSGVVVGTGYTINNEAQIFTYANGQTVDLGPAKGQAYPIAINDLGEILVEYSPSTNVNEPAIYANGTFTVIAPPANATVTAYAINNSGVVVGGISYNTNAAVPHAGLYSNGVWTDLGILAGAGRGTVAIGINSSGQILGMAAGKPIYKPDIGVPTMSCILRNGVWVELNTLIPTNSGFNLNLSRPVSINDAGQILINTKTSSNNGYKNAVLLTPKK
jgi:probable HAF family extracellular repeat protein